MSANDRDQNLTDVEIATPPEVYVARTPNIDEKRRAWQKSQANGGNEW